MGDDVNEGLKLEEKIWLLMIDYIRVKNYFLEYVVLVVVDLVLFFLS